MTWKLSVLANEILVDIKVKGSCSPEDRTPDENEVKLVSDTVFIIAGATSCDIQFPFEWLVNKEP